MKTDIYKCYKHGENMKELLQEYDIEKIYKELKNSGMQVVLVKSSINIKRLYNYVPETSRFYRIL